MLTGNRIQWVKTKGKTTAKRFSLWPKGRLIIAVLAICRVRSWCQTKTECLSKVASEKYNVTYESLNWDLTILGVLETACPKRPSHCRAVQSTPNSKPRHKDDDFKDLDVESKHGTGGQRSQFLGCRIAGRSLMSFDQSCLWLRSLWGWGQFLLGNTST